MGRILQRGDTGFGILIENDAGFITELNNNTLNENFEIEPNKPILIDCILQKWGVKNKNDRIYPKEVLIPQVEIYQDIIKNNSSISEADHPESSIISLQNISHLLTKMWWGSGEQENVLFGTIKLLVTPGFLKYGVVSLVGDKILLYLQNKIRLGISSRGVGSLKQINGENIVQNDFELIGFDLVATPSTPGAYLFPKKHDERNFNEIHSIENKPVLKENKLIKTLDDFLL